MSDLARRALGYLEDNPGADVLEVATALGVRLMEAVDAVDELLAAKAIARRV